MSRLTEEDIIRIKTIEKFIDAEKREKKIIKITQFIDKLVSTILFTSQIVMIILKLFRVISVKWTIIFVPIFIYLGLLAITICCQLLILLLNKKGY